MAYVFVKGLGWDEQKCRHVQDCITTHRFRMDNPPKTLEAKILFDADKLDVTGALGIARSLIYEGQVGIPLYTLDEDNQIQKGRNPDNPESFLKEYNFKLIKIYDHFYTEEAKKIAAKRKEITTSFYNELIDEVSVYNLDVTLGLNDENENR